MWYLNSSYKAHSIRLFSVSLIEKTYSNASITGMAEVLILIVQYVHDPAQHGFAWGRSTETTAGFFADYVYDYIDNGEQVKSLFFELSRAFDSLPFQLKVDKCCNMSFWRVFLDWLKNYLEDRSFFVKFGNCPSKVHDFSPGVPQGSVLALFKINGYFINNCEQNEHI